MTKRNEAAAVLSELEELAERKIIFHSRSPDGSYSTNFSLDAQKAWKDVWRWANTKRRALEPNP